MKLIASRIALLWLTVVVGACTSVPLAPPTTNTLFRDALFANEKLPIDVDRIFALSSEMQGYLNQRVIDLARTKGPQRGLFEALYDAGQLKIDYDAEYTRNAAETFAAKSGNCLSLAIMTGAFAKAIDLTVTYQRVRSEDVWSRNQDLMLRSEHVNVVLTSRALRGRIPTDIFERHTIDFYSLDTRGTQFVEPLDERTVVAMYLNNRAVEELSDGRVERAYWWVRAAILHDADLLSAYNTLGVIYRRHGALADAETVFNSILERDRRNAMALSNLAVVLRAQGRLTEAGAIAARLERADPTPPYHFFDHGQTALEKGDYQTAKKLFEREVARADYNPKFHFALAIAHFHLGEYEETVEHLRKAKETSTTSNDVMLYTKKLAALSSLGRKSIDSNLSNNRGRTD